MKIGDLIRWAHYEEVQYVPVFSERVGIIIDKGKSAAYAESVFVVDTKGEKIILYQNNETIKVINESR